jgi:hypothetical protein
VIKFLHFVLILSNSHICNCVVMHQHFEQTCCPHFQGRREAGSSFQVKFNNAADTSHRQTRSQSGACGCDPSTRILHSIKTNMLISELKSCHTLPHPRAASLENVIGNQSFSEMQVCMYIRMYVCTYVCVYVCTYVCMYVRMYLCTYVCMYVCTCVVFFCKSFCAML